MSEEETPEEKEKRLVLLASDSYHKASEAQTRATCFMGMREIHYLLEFETHKDCRLFIKVEASGDDFESGTSSITIRSVDEKGLIEKSKAIIDGRLFLKFLQNYLEEQAKKLEDEDELPF